MDPPEKKNIPKPPLHAQMDLNKNSADH